MSQHTAPNERSQEWLNCAPGTLSSISRREKRKATNTAIARVAGVGLAVVLGLGIGFSMLPNTGSDTQKVLKLSCADTMSMLNGYFASDLSISERENVHSHLNACASCKKHYEREAENRGIDFLLGLAPPQIATARLVVSLCMTTQVR